MAWYYQKTEDPSIPTMQAALSGKTVEVLKSYATLLKVAKPPTRKQELINLVLEHLQGPKLIALWERLDDLQKAAVAEVTHGPDTIFHPGRFKAKYGALPVVAVKTEKTWSYREEPTPLALFFYRNVMPNELKERLKTIVPPPQETRLATTAELPAATQLTFRVFDYQKRQYNTLTEEFPLTRRDTERAAQQDLPTVLRLTEAGKVAVSEKTLRPSEATMKTVASVLRSGDFYPPEHDEAKSKSDQKIGHIMPFAWPMILQAGKLGELDGKKLVLTKTGRKALSLPPHEMLRDLWLRWVKNRNFDELNRVEAFKGQNGNGKRGLTGKAGRREVIVEALKTCPPGAWVEFSGFSRYMQAANYSFEVTREPWELYIEDKNYGNLGYEGFADWRILQARYILALLFEYAATLGLIDVAYIAPERARLDYRDLWGTDDYAFLSRYDGLQYFRVNALGAYCLGLTTKYEATPLQITSTLTVLPSLKVLVIGEPLAMDEALLLEAYADKLSAQEWHLSLEKTMSVVENGRDVSELREFLEKREEQFLPETVERFLRDAADKKRRFQDKGTAYVLDCGSAEMAETLSSHAGLKRFCLRAGESSLLVYTETEEKFRKTLHTLGYCWPRN